MKPDVSRIQSTLAQVAHAEPSELTALLHKYQEVPQAERGMLLNMIKVIRAPSPDQQLEIVDTREAGPFTMVVVRVPWDRGRGVSHLQPVLLHTASGPVTLAGYVLPFNSIIPLLSPHEMASAERLGAWYAEVYAASEMRGG